MVNGQEKIFSPFVVLAVGHSARDTFALLEEKKIPMEPKSFAVGPQGRTSPGFDQSVPVRKGRSGKSWGLPHTS